VSKLKEKTISGLFWSFIDNFSNQFINFIVGIILARLLSPVEFGVIGMITIFIALSQIFIDSGFSSALIRNKHCSHLEYNTTFYFNIFIAFLLYFLLFSLSKPISQFYNEPQLTSIIRALGLTLIINSFTIIQRTILVKETNFKLLTKISIISSLLSGIVAIYMAYKGFGVWSLVFKTLLQQFMVSILLWTWNKWRPSLVYSFNTFKNLFSFGSKLMVSSIINTIFQNIYYLIIGKYYSAVQLGYYSRADQFNSLPVTNITNVIQRVSYPILAEMQDDIEKLKKGYKKLIISTTFISFTLLLIIAAIAKPMIITLIGEKWLPAVPMLQMLCFASMLYPLHALNLNILMVKGRSDLFLKLEIIKKAIYVPVVVVGVKFGINYLIAGLIFISFFAFFLIGYWSGKFINYPAKEQLMDILPSFVLSLFISLIVYFFDFFTSFNTLTTFIMQITLGLISIIFFAEIFKINGYLEIKTVIKDLYLKNKIKNAE